MTSRLPIALLLVTALAPATAAAQAPANLPSDTKLAKLASDLGPCETTLGPADRRFLNRRVGANGNAKQSLPALAASLGIPVAQAGQQELTILRQLEARHRRGACGSGGGSNASPGNTASTPTDTTSTATDTSSTPSDTTTTPGAGTAASPTGSGAPSASSSGTGVGTYIALAAMVLGIGILLAQFVGWARGRRRR